MMVFRFGIFHGEGFHSVFDTGIDITLTELIFERFNVSVVLLLSVGTPKTPTV